MPEVHFPGCHPDDDEAPTPPEGYLPMESEPCWHCAAVVPRSCFCSDCLEHDADVPASCTYHCRACNRWWAWMTLKVTTLRF